MAASSAPVAALLLNRKSSHKFNKVQCSSLLRGFNTQRFSSANRNLVVRRATPEVAGEVLSSSPLPDISAFQDNLWVGICGVVVAVPVIIQRIVAYSKQLDAAAQTVENIADAVENIADEVDKAAEGLKEALPEGKLKAAVAYVEKLAEYTSDGADKISDVMDKVEEIDDKLEEFLDKNVKGS